MDASCVLKIFVIFFLLLALMPAVSGSVRIGAEVGGSLKGEVSWINVTGNPLQRVNFFWINTGSAACRVRGRVDFHRWNESFLTAWSGEKVLMPGEEKGFEITAKLPEGRYAGLLRVYQCNEIFDAGSYVFDVSPSGDEGDRIELAGARTYQNEIEVFVESSSFEGKVYVFPVSYPPGWIVESGNLTLSGDGISSVRIGYDPGVWVERNVTFMAVSEDGRFSSEKTYRMIRGAGVKEMIFLVVLGGLVLALFMIISSGKCL